MSQISIDQAFDLKCRENEIQLLKGTKGTYTLFTEKGICLAASAAVCSWAYKDTTEYWYQKIFSNALFPSKVFCLKQVTYFNPNFYIDKVPPGIYHVYLRHGGNYVSTECRLFVKDSIQEKQVGTVHPFDHHLLKLFQDQVCNTYVATIDLSSYQDKKLSFNIQLFSDTRWLYNYFFEGGLLVPATDLNSVPLYFKLKKDMHLELDWYQTVTPVFINGNMYEEKVEEESPVVEIAPEDKEVYDKIDEIWKEYDVNQNDYLDREEFHEFMNAVFDKFNIPSSEYQTEQLFKSCDSDHTGLLKKSYLVDITKQILTLEKQVQQQEEEEQSEEKEDLFERGQDINNYNEIEFTAEIEVLTNGTVHEGPENLLSSSEEGGSKLCITESGDGTVVLNFSEEVEFDAIGIKSANDERERNPAYIELYLTDNEGNKEKVLTQDHIKFEDFWETLVFDLKSAPCITKTLTLKFSARYHQVQFGQLILFQKKVRPVKTLEGEEVNESDHDNYSSIELKGEVVGETEGTTHEDAPNLISDSEAGNSKWCVTGSSQGSVLLKLDEEITFKAFGIKSANDEPYRDPDSMELYLVDDDENEILIMKISGINFDDRWQTKIYSLSKCQKGKFFKINIQNDKIDQFQLGQILFYAD